MGSGSGVDLFSGFNEGEASEVLRRCVGCGRFVLIGPPRSGKTFFREKYLEGRLGAGVTVDEHTPGITTTTKTEGKEAKGELGLREKVMRILEGMIPLIGRLREKVRVDVEELRRILGDRAPRHVVEGARGMIRDSPHRAYYIPWKCVEEPNECTSDADASKALELIKGVFDDKKVTIKWFNADYIPPGLVEEVIELIREKGEGGAREVLEGWVDAYFKAIDTLSKVLGLKENLLEWDELSIGFLSEFVNNSANYVIGGLALTPFLGAASLALISVLTYMAFKREGENYLREIIELRESLERLLVKGPDGGLDFNELGGLLVYRVAYAMGMSYDEAKEALMGITGLGIKDLEERVKEIEEKIEKLEKKIELFRQEAPAGIVTADVGEFAEGRIYPNIKVENGELRVRVEDGYHSIVRAGKFNELVNEVRDRLLKQGFAVVVGPKGIGKSTLAAAVIWKLFMNGDIGLVARVDVLDSKKYSKLTTFIENYGEKLGKYFGRLLILYDPVLTEAYERADIDVKADIQANIEMTIDDLMKAIKSISSEASKPLTLIVIPSDVYNALSEERRNELEGYRLDVLQGLINTEFLAELIREYTRTKSNPNGCALSDRELSELTGELAKFDSGHALIARLIGEELARSNCDVGKIEELISKAKGKAEAFIILHINGLFKVHEDPDTAKALVEVFALRRPFVDSVRPSVPILTQGIIELIGEERGAKILYGAEGGELRGWLVHRQHDLIEEAIKKLLKCIISKGEECKELGTALNPWKIRGVRESLMEVSEKVSDVGSAVEYFASNYGKKLTNTLKVFSNECWKRAALIIGAALAGIPTVPRPEDLSVMYLLMSGQAKIASEDLRKSVVESLGDALKRCGVDYYLLVSNEIPPLIIGLAYTPALAWAFIDKYNEAVGEVRRILNIARGRGISYDERLYGLGLASIIVKAVESGKPIEPSDADAVLTFALSTIQRVALSGFIMPILYALRPLRGKAPQRYIELLAAASGTGDLDSGTVRYILSELSYVLSNYGDVVRGYAWSLVHAIDAYANLLGKYLVHFNSEEVRDVVGRVAYLLNELGRFSPSLGIIAWAYALAPALMHGNVRRPMEEALGIDVVDKAGEVLEELNDMRERVQELMRDEEFMGYVKSKFVEADEEAVKKEIRDAASHLKEALAHYRLNNSELDKAKELFEDAFKEYREIGEYVNYLTARGWVLRVEAIKSSSVGKELVDGFRQLYEETFKKPYEHTVPYLNTASLILGNYLVSLALMGDHETINKLLERHLWVLNADGHVSVLTRLMLNALLSPKGRLSGELEGKLGVNPEELIDAFGSDMYGNSLPALMVAFRMISPEDGIKLCQEFNDIVCIDFVLAVKGNSVAVKRLREAVINAFNASKNSLKGFGFDVESLINKFRGLVSGLDGRSLVQLIAPSNSMAQLALMLRALIDGNKELAKAHALYGAVSIAEKLPTRLFLEAYRACCDLGKDEFRRAVARLFFFHV